MKCYPEKRGFRFDKGSIACRACNEQYPLTEIEKEVGSCYPIKLEGRLQADLYRIPSSSLGKMSDRF
jgi:hypothetical protein